VIEDSDHFALVIPTYEGTPFLRRTLDYLREIAFPGLVVLADDSSGAHREFAAAAPGAYPELWLEHHAFDHGTRFLVKLAETLKRLPARYVMLCAQDDFPVTEGIEAVLAAFDADAGLSVARGRVGRFRIKRTREGDAERFNVQLLQHPMRAYTEPDAAQRVLAMVADYSATLYSVHRRELLIEALEATERQTRNVIFFQYLWSCINAAQGRIACIDELFYVRQAHAESWAAKLQNDYEHWPLLIASPDYSTHFLAFRAAVAGLLDATAEGGAARMQQFDRAYVELVRRGLFSAGAPNPGDEAFFRRLSDRGTEDGARLGAIVAFCQRYPETC
jgi:glycosyltransferase domain-containing protein